ncbi:MAG: circadian clock KaiB family protein [Thiohalocapsa sp.]|nr:circadian clock KaiB family protein [Thiohalocapsa sp.]MCF7991862.1 circadian clock KaiB family protein [Thiohalocapsa sp.]
MPVRMNRQTKELIAAAREMQHARYVLRLYVAGMTPRSAEAIRRVTDFCEKHLTEQYELEIIDIYQKPALMRGEQIVAVPTLVKHLPEPLRRLIGDMQDEDKLLFGMDLVTRPK